MENKMIHSVTAIFDTPDEIIHASKETVKAGYKKFDTNTPYPVHGIEKAMGIGSSYLGFFTLFLGLSGAAFAFAFIYWVSAIDYPLIIGGKPFFSWPAFVPVTFEVTVLSAAVGTVLTMIALFFKFPNNSHALHDTTYMKKVSCDKFGLCIVSIDKNFEEAKVTDFLKSIGGKDIETIYYPEKKEINPFDPKFIMLLVLVALVVSGGTYFMLNKLIFMEPFTWMAVQDRLDPQSKNIMFADGFGMRLPVEGTVARGHLPYEFKGMTDSAVKVVPNPLIFSKEVVAKGKEKYNTFCSPCHGYYGKGDSRLNGQFPNPPTLHSDKVRNWQDANVYHVIFNGQNAMPSYAKQLTADEGWSIVHYIRVLQRSQNALDADVEGK